MNNYIKVRVEGKNVNNYINWLIKSKIEIINLDVIKHNQLEIIIEYKYYKKLLNYSKTYKIYIIEKYGKIKLLEKALNNLPIITSIILSIILLYILSNTIFSVKIIYNDQKITNILKKELEKYNIKKYRRKKDFEYLNKVKNNILKDNKDILEWIEIKEKGTTYIIKVVERKKQKIEKGYTYQSLISKKDAIITNIKAYSGEKIKNKSQYVKKGEVVISGILITSDNQKIYTKALGYIEGEVWYKVSIEYPLYYKEERLTGKSKNTITITFLNHEFSILSNKKYKSFQYKSNTIMENNIMPFGLKKEKLYETKIEEQIYTPEEAIKKASKEVENKLIKSNQNIKKINKIQVLKQKYLNSKIELQLFVSVTEDITDIMELIPEENIP